MNNLSEANQSGYFDVSGKLYLPPTAEPQQLEMVWVPTQQVFLTDVRVPGKRKSDWMRALPYALEESISQPLDEVYIAVLNRQTSGEQEGLTSVAVVDRTLMQNWVEALQSAGLSKAQLVADCFQLAWAEEQVSGAVNTTSDTVYLQSSQGYLVRNRQWGGFWLPLSWKALPQFSFVDGQIGEVQPLTTTEIKSFGLRQGEFQPVSQASQLGWQGRSVVILLLAIVGLWVGQNWLIASQKQSQQQQLVTATEQLFKQMFPNVKRIVNIQAQTQTALNQQQSGGQVMGPAALSLLIESNFKQAAQVKIERFKWQNGRLILTLKSADSMALESLKQSLTQQLQAKAKVTLNIKKMQPNDIAAEMVLDVS